MCPDLTFLTTFVAKLGLNPFDIRACVRTGRSPQVLYNQFSLNPFDIRACVRTTARSTTSGAASRLNPFDIRACVRTAILRHIESGAGVLIPLISGHVSGPSHRVTPTKTGAS